MGFEIVVHPFVPSETTKAGGRIILGPLALLEDSVNKRQRLVNRVMWIRRQRNLIGVKQSKGGHVARLERGMNEWVMDSQNA
jgi:hypothetical protein